MRYVTRPLAIPAAALAAGLLLLAACHPPEFDPSAKITDLRILAIRADPVEVAPGGEVTITGLAVSGDGTPYAGYWVFVLLSGEDFDAATEGEALDPTQIPLDRLGIQEPGGEPFVYTVPDAAGIAESFGAYDPRGTLVTVGALIAGGAESVEDLLALKGEIRLAFKTFLISERPEEERNRNPIFEEIGVEYGGMVPPKDEEGNWLLEYGGSVRLVGKFENLVGNEEATYSWFSVQEQGIEATRDKVQNWLVPHDSGVFYVYVVCRNNYRFEDPDGFITRSTGLDFGWATFRVP